MAFFIVIREAGNNLRVANYKVMSRSHAAELNTNLVKNRGYSPLNLFIAVGKNEAEALQHAAEYFKTH